MIGKNTLRLAVGFSFTSFLPLFAMDPWWIFHPEIHHGYRCIYKKFSCL